MSTTTRWRETELGRVAEIERTVLPPERIITGTSYVGLEHIDSEGSIATARGVDAGELRSAKFAFSERHVLYGKLRPYLRKIARPTFSGVCSTDILPILPGPDIDRDYLFFCLRQPRLVGLAAARSHGANLPRLSPGELARFRIPLPALTEQRRIAAILDKAAAVRRRRKESLRLLNDFLRSAFLEMFGDLVRNEKGWPTAPASSVIAAIEPGSSVKGDERERGAEEWAVLKISAVTSGWYLPRERKVVAAPPQQPVIPRRGDLLFSRANTRELVAATCLVDREDPRLFLPDKLWRITPNDDRALVGYLRFLLADARFRQTLTRYATGTSGSMLNVSQEKLLRLELPLPPLPLQRHFGALVGTVFAIRARVIAAEDRASELVDSLVQQAFGGRAWDDWIRSESDLGQKPLAPDKRVEWYGGKP